MDFVTDFPKILKFHFTNILILLWRLLASAGRSWYVEPILLAEDVKCSPTSSWWALGTLAAQARLGFGMRLSGERSGGCGRSIGKEIGYRSRHYIGFLNTALFDGIEFRKEGGDGGSSEDRGLQGSAVLKCDVDMSHVLPSKRTRAAAVATGVQNSPTLQVQVGSKEVLPHKKRNAVSRPRRGCMGLHFHRGAFSHGGDRSCGAELTRAI
jgi:hypothetical protein